MKSLADIDLKRPQFSPNPYWLSRMRPVLLLFAILSCGCGHTAVVQSWQPAEVDVAGINRVAVMDFSGETGSAVALALAGRLWENEFYRVVDRTELMGRIQTAGYEDSQSIPPGDVLQLAKSAGLDGIILGDVLEFHCEDDVRRSTEFRWRSTSDDEPESRSFGRSVGFQRKEKMVRKGNVTIAFRLVDVKTGEVRASREVTREFRGEKLDDGDELPAPREVLATLTRQCLDDVVEMLAPHETECHIRLATCDFWTKCRGEVRRGVRLAEQGEWEQARQAWLRVVELDPENHAALFNLAVAAAHLQDYCEAEDFAMQSLRIQHKECYTRGLESIRRQRTAFERSREQRDSQLITTADSLWD